MTVTLIRATISKLVYNQSFRLDVKSALCCSSLRIENEKRHTVEATLTTLFRGNFISSCLQELHPSCSITKTKCTKRLDTNPIRQLPVFITSSFALSIFLEILLPLEIREFMFSCLCLRI